jgi:hypothetical protein
MKLSEEKLNIGRNCILNKDYDGLEKWFDDNGIIINKKEFLAITKKLLAVDNQNRAIKLFNEAFENYDPFIENLKIAAGCWINILVILGVLGGVVYLISFLFRC